MTPEIGPHRVPLGPVLLVNFIGTMGFSIIMPFLVFLVTRLGGNPVLYGVVAATYPAFQFIGSPILGRWSDRFGRRRILLLSQAGTLASWLIFSMALFLPVTPLFTVESGVLGEFTITVPLLVILLARALDGITGGNISVANAYVADVSRDEERSANFGRMGVAANLGVIAGPALASLLGTTALAEALPVFVATAIAGVGTIVIAAALPESNPRVPRKDCGRREAGKSLGQEQRCALLTAREKPMSVRVLMGQANVPFMMALYFVILLAFNFFYTAFPIHAVQGLGWSVAQMGVFFVTLSAVLVIVEGPVLSRLSRRFPEPALIIVGLVILGTNFVLLTSTHTGLVFLSAVLFAIGNGIMWPPMVSLVSKMAKAEYQGHLQGLTVSVGSLASIVGLILGGIAYSTIGAGTFLISAALAYLAFLLAFRLPRLHPAAASTP